jgi:hypothetical protein
MSFEISTKARNVHGFERSEEIHRIPVFIAIRHQPAGDGDKILMDVAVQRITISAPHGFGPWFAAASDAQLRVRADEGMSGESTDTQYVSGEVIEEDAIETKTKAEFKPEVKVSEKLTISVSSVGGGNKKITTRKSKFSGRKGDLSLTKLGSSVVWDGLKGLNESAVGQSLAGNINLWVTCEWPKKKRKRLGGTSGAL